jgi:hypothetical protein
MTIGAVVLTIASIFAAKADKKFKSPTLNKGITGNGEFTLISPTNIFTIVKASGYFQPSIAIVTAGGTWADYAPSLMYTAVNGVKPIYMH